MYNMANALLRAAEKQDEELWQLIESGDLCALGRKIVDLAEQDVRAEVEEEIKP